MITVRDIREGDLPEIACWFEKRKWPFPAVAGVFPKVGAVALDGDKLLACAWIYTTNTPVAYLEWTATNPEVDDGIGQRGLTDVIERLKEGCKAITPPIEILVHHTTSDKLASRFARQGFRKAAGFTRVLWLAEKA